MLPNSAFSTDACLALRASSGAAKRERHTALGMMRKQIW